MQSVEKILYKHIMCVYDKNIYSELFYEKYVSIKKNKTDNNK